MLLTTLMGTLLPIPGLYAQDQGQDQPEAKPQTLTEKLGGDDRYLTHLATDKPIYRAGEAVYVRGTILHAFTHKPFEDKQAEIEALDKQIEAINAKQAIDKADRKQMRELAERRWQMQQQNQQAPTIEIKDPKGATVASGQAQVENSSFGFKWDVPADQAGGQYTVKVSHPWSGLAPAERTFDIRAYRAPRIKTQIQFLKDGYGPGDSVVATLQATRAEGGAPAGAKVTAIARVDGEEVARVESTVGESGSAEARFDLPGQITRGEGSLTFVIEDGGVVESASKTLPILLQTVDLSLYPEGGDLVAGIENRVYFEAKTPYGKPADIKGYVHVVFEDGVVSEFFDSHLVTTHEGRGVFTIKPGVGAKYVIKITEPSSVTKMFELPAAIASGLTLSPFHPDTDNNKLGLLPGRFYSSVFGNDETLGFKILSTDVDTVKVVIRQRERVVYEQTLEGIKNTPGSLVMATPDKLDASISGILTATAYDAAGKPLAERLVYRAPKDRVNIEILPDSAQYTPGGKVQMSIKTTDAQGKPVSAYAGLTVTDDSVLEMIETREQAPMLPAMVMLEQEVQELADAQVYLDPSNPDAANQLDLLLGTQGWRRFALVNLEDFILEHGDDARRVLALRVPVREEMLHINRAMARGGAEADGVLLFNAVPAAAAPELAEDAAADPAAPVEEALAQADKNEDAPAIVDEKPDLAKVLDQAVAKEQAQGRLIAAEDAREAKRVAFEPMVYIREYAHKQPAGKPFGERSDFTETVYWSSATRTGEDGLATVEFDLSDSVTSFRVKADAFTKDGALGAGTGLIESVRPFYIEPKLPLELTAGDKVLLPIAVINNTDRELAVQMLASRLGAAGTVDLDPLMLNADSRSRALYELVIADTYGELGFNLEARAGNLFDQNNRKLRVVPRGFPIKDGSGGMLQPDGEATDKIIIPDTVVPGSLVASVTVYPTPLANLTEALEALIHDPYGCFEQTSSTTFPLVMAQQYFLTHQGVDPAIIAKAQEKLDAGYKRLIGFETKDKGYEWFGSTPPHEALTAYGLLQFNEMKDVMDVDQKMIERTSDWLMARRDGNGSFKLDDKQLDSFGGAPQETTNAYIVWSLLEAGYDPAKIEKEIEHVLKQATEGNDTYIVALGANIAQLTGRDQAGSLLKKLADKLNDEGFVDGAVTSITRSGGDALNIETTSLAILAWLRDDQYTKQVEKSMLWLTERCKAGRFGSTQSTVLALKAIVEYDKARSTPKAPGELVLLVDGKPVGEPVKFTKETKGAIHLPAFADKLTPGQHTVAVLMDGGSKMPYSINVEYYANTPASSDECMLRIQTQLLNLVAGKLMPLKEGETTEVSVKVSNVTKDGLPTPIAIVGIPGGLEPSYDQLKELVKAGTIASFEVIGRDVVLYWRELKPEQVVDLSIRCTAAIPGTYTGPASRTYLYYTDEFKHWVDGLSVTITPRNP